MHLESMWNFVWQGYKRIDPAIRVVFATSDIMQSLFGDDSIQSAVSDCKLTVLSAFYWFLGVYGGEKDPLSSLFKLCGVWWTDSELTGRYICMLRVDDKGGNLSARKTSHRNVLWLCRKGSE